MTEANIDYGSHVYHLSCHQTNLVTHQTHQVGAFVRDTTPENIARVAASLDEAIADVAPLMPDRQWDIK